MKKLSIISISTVFTIILGAILYYLFLPAINIKNVMLWTLILVLLFAFILIASTLQEIQDKKLNQKRNTNPVIRVSTYVFVVILLAFIVLSLASSKLFRAKQYSQVLTVTDGTVETLPSVEGTSSIALMDTASAEKLGNREIGSLTEVVSQYDVSSYTQIDYQGTPVKVSPLRYAGFFKWIQNSDNGVPGYVVVNPVHMNAEYVAVNQGMKYVPSAYFSKDLYRHVRFQYPTELLGNMHFEIDGEGNPWYILSTYDHLVGLFGGEQVNGIILVNPFTGESEKLSVQDVPEWVDVVFHGDLICEQYNNYAQLHKGFWNSKFSQVGSKKVTEYTGDDDDEASTSDYGYVSKDGDIWIYTGVTSVNSDSSNIGFLLANERTEETIFIECAGADEFSAMAAAEGEVQEKGYQASFPSLILVDDVPTYIMVLKDDGGLVKMYAAVNVQQYNMVSTSTTQQQCINQYIRMLGGDTVTTETVDDTDWEAITITVQKLETIVVDGNTYLYVLDENNHVYSSKYIDVLDMLTVEVGDEITIRTNGTMFTYNK